MLDGRPHPSYSEIKMIATKNAADTLAALTAKIGAPSAYTLVWNERGTKIEIVLVLGETGATEITGKSADLRRVRNELHTAGAREA